MKRLVNWLLCGILALILVGELAADPAPLPEPPPLAEAKTMAPVAATPAFDSSEMVARPLFFASRAPLPPDLATAPATPVSTPELSLVGTVLSPAGNVAVVRQARQTKSLHLAVGQSVDGWTVSEVTGDRLILSAGTATHVVALPEIGGKRTAAAQPVTVPLPARGEHPPATSAGEAVERPTYSQSRPTRGRGR